MARPRSIDGHRKGERVIALRVSDKQHRALLRHAKREGVSVSELLRRRGILPFMAQPKAKRKRAA
jgi:predicted HicB family RNase H-like nuclease